MKKADLTKIIKEELKNLTEVDWKFPELLNAVPSNEKAAFYKVAEAITKGLAQKGYEKEQIKELFDAMVETSLKDSFPF